MYDLVNGDKAADQKAMMVKYANMTDAEIKSHTETNVKAIETIMEAAVKNYVKEDLHLVATIDLAIIKYINEGMAKLFAEIDAEADAKLKHMDFVKTGMTSEVIRAMAQNEDKRRADNPIKVTDTAENLLKKYKAEYKKMLDLLELTVAQEKKEEKKLGIWVNVHQKASKMTMMICMT